MSNLSGYDSEVVGFESVSQNRRSETSSSTQTSEFSEGGMGSQTSMSKDCGCMTNPDDFPLSNVINEVPDGLNEFLRKVVPGVMEQLDLNEKDDYVSSDSDSEEVVSAKFVQEVNANTDMSAIGAGDFQSSILSISWSSAGNSLAVSIGQNQHENWCEHDGLIRIYTLKCSADDKFVHDLDISEKNCVSVVRYHPSLAALLAYGTTTGEVVVCNLRNSHKNFEQGMSLTSPNGCHGTRRVTSLQWADAMLANVFLTYHIKNTSKRRSASDQILISSGSDGTVNVWQANPNSNTFTNVVCYTINGSRNMPAPDISCLDFIKSLPLRPSDEKVPTDVFVVGTSSGKLYLCKIKPPQQISNSVIDPVYEVLEGHATYVLDVAFNHQKPGVFASISMDSELRIYDVNQASPLKVVCLEVQLSCLSWLPGNPNLVVVGSSSGSGGEQVKVYDATTGHQLRVDGFQGQGTITCLTVRQSGTTCRIAAGNIKNAVQIWELPSRRIRMKPNVLEF